METLMPSEILTEASRLSVKRAAVKGIFDRSEFASKDWGDLKSDAIKLMMLAYDAGSQSATSQYPFPTLPTSK